MPTPFTFPNNITAGTPAVAAEVQDNFDDLYAWIYQYYQQSAETTAEIAAAIAAIPASGITLVAYANGFIFGDIEASSFTTVPVGPSVTWTAEINHIYMPVYYNYIIILDTSTDNGYRTANLGYSVNGGSYLSAKRYAVETVQTSPGGGSGYRPAIRELQMDNSFFLTSLSGSTTLQLGASTFYGSGGPAPTDTMLQLTGHLAVFDLGTAP